MTQTLAAVVLPPLVDPASLASAFPEMTPEELESAVTEASNTIRRPCGWHIAPPLDFDLVLDGTGAPTMFLPTLRLNAVTAVSDDGTDLDATTVEWSADGMIRRGSSCWTRKFRGVRVQFNSGFRQEELGGVSDIITALIKRPASDPTGQIASKSVGGVSISYAPAAGSRGRLTESDQALLASYKLPRRH